MRLAVSVGWATMAVLVSMGAGHRGSAAAEPAQVLGECRDGGTVTVKGTVKSIYHNSSPGNWPWVIHIEDGLNVAECPFAGVATPTPPPTACHVGAKITATVKWKLGLASMPEMIDLSCADKSSAVEQNGSTASASTPLPCALTDQDYAAIAQGLKHYAPTDLDKLPPTKQQVVCDTRALVRKINAASDRSAYEISLTIEPDEISAAVMVMVLGKDYTTPEEWKLLDKVIGLALVRKDLERGR